MTAGASFEYLKRKNKLIGRTKARHQTARRLYSRVKHRHEETLDNVALV